MSVEQIHKLQPDRTLYLRGFTGVGAAASLYNASPTGFTVSGVFRDMADFCVLVIYDADNVFEHYSVKYLPDFDLSGVVLTFNLSYNGLQPLDSAKYSWVDWSQLDVITQSGQPMQVRLWDHATLASGTYSVAQGTYHITAPGNCNVYDRLTLFVNNASFDFVAGGGETAAYVAQTFANSINTYDWAAFANSSVSVIASADGSGNLTLKNARAGHVNVSGTSVSWVDGIKFPGIAAGSTIYLGGSAYTVAAVNSPTSLTLTSAAAAATNISYLGEYGGLDGNGVTTYMVVRPGNVNLAVDKSVLPLAGGNSDNVTWAISLDFSALGIDHVRQAWMTFAPRLANGAAYADTEWTATFSGWTVSDPKDVSLLKCAGPGSSRTGNQNLQSCTYSSSGWSMVAANNYWHGFGQLTNQPGSSVMVKYSCQQVHDLYLGTSLYSDRGIVSVSVDGDAATQLDCFLNVSSEVVTRRKLRASIAAGTHTVTLTVLSSNHTAVAGWDFNSSRHNFLFDYIEAAVPGDFPDAIVTYNNVSPALDFDTDATYKVSPQRLLWHLTKLGFRGQIEEYMGVFWWNQRKRIGGAWNSAVITFAGTWTPGDSAVVAIGGFRPAKSVTTWDTVDTIAAHFVYYINAASVSMWAEKTGNGQLTIHTRTPNWGDAIAASANSASGTVTVSGNLNVGVDGTWQIDASASNVINFPIRQWHSDFFRLAASLGLPVTSAFSMELVNPPDDGTAANTWQARFFDGTPVTTDTGFSHLFSSQCVPGPNLQSLQAAAYTTIAGLQSAAGLTPWLQFGEFLWWFFSSMSQPVGYCAYTDPVSIGVATPHGMQTGDRVVISGIEGCTIANGTWTITVTDANHFTIPVSANGAWVVGTGQVRGGSMAYYDAVTSAAAQTALGRPLYKFTCQDDDPSVNGAADAQFLASRLKGHVDAIRNAVLAQFPNARFELLYPNDVNNPVCYLGPNVAYPQGGRLNAAVNLPPQWKTKAGSGFDRFKVEGLSWGAQYRHLDLAQQAIVFPLTPPLSWNVSDVAYLLPWFNGGCPWPAEFHAASSRGLPLINLWAYDHLALMSWPLPFPTPIRRSFFAG
ncbi:MAG: hypothetical protein JOZ62_21170 [Acidobacteriaceae bacterium]|nr:hypothetical protein [Acidobacteriaceae bacterium]